MAFILRNKRKILVIILFVICALLVYRSSISLKGDRITGLKQLNPAGISFKVKNTDHDGDYELPLNGAYDYFELLKEADYEKAEASAFESETEGIELTFEGSDAQGNKIQIIIKGYQLMSITLQEKTEFYKMTHKTVEQTQRLLRASNIILDIIQNGQ